jgi:hypothetical protein
MKNNTVRWTVATFVITFIMLICEINLMRYLGVSTKDCNPNYSGCVTGYNCSQVGETVEVIGVDIYGLDGDGDGRGCDRSGSSMSGVVLLALVLSFGAGALVRNLYRKSFTKRKLLFDETRKKQEYEDAKRRGLLCPKDAGILRLRKGKFGDFYGCSNYPVCSFTKRPEKRA